MGFHLHPGIEEIAGLGALYLLATGGSADRRPSRSQHPTLRRARLGEPWGVAPCPVHGCVVGRDWHDHA
jgi:hypothetical protein